MEELDKILLKDYNKMPINQLAYLLGITQKEINERIEILKESGKFKIKPKKKLSNILTRHKKDIIERYQGLTSTRVIALHYKVNPDTIRRYLIKWGVELRSAQFKRRYNYGYAKKTNT